MQNKRQGGEPNGGPSKTAGNNQWTSGHLRSEPDKRERRDGPGGENGASDKKQ